MKLNNIFKFAVIAAAAATVTGVTSCNYLDVVPPEQPGLADGMKNHDNAKGFLYSCYNKMFQRDFMPRDYRSTINASTDEYLITETWYANEGAPAYAILRNTQTTTAPGGYNPDFWNTFYAGIGQTILFEQQLDSEGKKNNVNEGNDAEYREWKAEARFCRAFYHFQLLRLYGPIPITTSLLDKEMGLDAYPGRTHFDGCVDWIANELDKAADDLPATREAQDLGRATSVICKALKGRLLLYAASDLWNGKFPSAYNGWRNTNYKSSSMGKDYGYELVYRSQDGSVRKDRWVQALVATKEALEAALAAGHQLYDPKWNTMSDNIDGLDPNNIWVPNETAFEKMMETALMPYTNISGYDFEATPEVEEGEEAGDDRQPFSMDEFRRAVWKMRLLSSTTQGEGNTEIIWSQSDQVYGWKDARLPRNAYNYVNNNSNNVAEGWNGVAPTLYTIEHFLNADGSLPSGNQGDGYVPVLENDAFYTTLTGTATAPLETGREEVAKICLYREPRFYAWIGFHGGDYLGLKANENNDPLILNMRNENMQGRKLTQRNYSATGFLSMKHVDPAFVWYEKGKSRAGKDSPEVFIRLAELYLNLAECEAEYAQRFGNQVPAELSAWISNHPGAKPITDLEQDAIAQINKLRDRAYVGRLETKHIGIQETLTSNSTTKPWTLVEWVRNERFIELYDEGQRYFDVRRWMAGEEYFGYGKRRGLNALVQNPKLEDFYTPMMASPQYTFHQREYLYPIYVDEVYKNPQMVQNPGF